MALKPPLTSQRFKKLRLMTCLARYGMVDGLYLFAKLSYMVAALKAKKTGLVKIKAPGITHPVFLRLGTSDVKAFIQVLMFQEYEMNLPFTPHTILDGGANIGMTSVYFANKYPSAKIVSVEPDSGNFETLQRNVAAYPNVTAVRGGLWPKTTQLVIRDGGLGEWNFRVEEAPAGETGIPAFSIGDLMKQHAPNGFDMVKMDIEGSEVEVLSAADADEWLAPARVFITELHDRMKPGCSKSFLNAMNRHNFAVEPLGESFLCVRA